MCFSAFGNPDIPLPVSLIPRYSLETTTPVVCFSTIAQIFTVGTRPKVASLIIQTISVYVVSPACFWETAPFSYLSMHINVAVLSA
jgi:hypothetical protein